MVPHSTATQTWYADRGRRPCFHSQHRIVKNASIINSCKLRNLETAFHLHPLLERILQCRRLLRRRRHTRPPRQRAVSPIRLQGALDRDKPTLDRQPVRARDDRLQRLRLRDLPALVELHEAHARARNQIRHAADDARAAGDEGLEGEVGGAAEGQEIGFGLGGDAGEFARVAAGELDADDVGMFSEGQDVVGGEVEAGGGTGEVVDEDGDRGGGRDVAEVVEEGGVVHERLVVAGRQDKDVVSSGVGGVLAELDGFAGGRCAAADDEGHGRGSRGIEGAAGRGRNEFAFLTVEMHGFAVAALDDEAGDTGVGEVGGVFLDGGEIDLLVVLEEGDSWHVDAGDEGPSCCCSVCGHFVCCCIPVVFCGGRVKMISSVDLHGTELPGRGAQFGGFIGIEKNRKREERVCQRGQRRWDACHD